MADRSCGSPLTYIAGSKQQTCITVITLLLRQTKAQVRSLYDLLNVWARKQHTCTTCGLSNTNSPGQLRDDDLDEIIINDGLVDTAVDSHFDEIRASGGSSPSISEVLPDSNPGKILLDDQLDAVAPPLRALEITRFLALEASCLHIALCAFIVCLRANTRTSNDAF